MTKIETIIFHRRPFYRRTEAIKWY